MCLDLINRILPLNIANLHYLSAEATKPGIPDLASEIKQCLSEEALYACTYWIDHLRDTRVSSRMLRDAVKVFIFQKIVDWIEIAAVLGFNTSLSNIWTCINVSATKVKSIVQGLNKCTGIYIKQYWSF